VSPLLSVEIHFLSFMMSFTDVEIRGPALAQELAQELARFLSSAQETVVGDLHQPSSENFMNCLIPCFAGKC
jgi:hypothetical protein